jgi:hypothetical protein
MRYARSLILAFAVSLMLAGGATAYTYAPQPPTTKQMRGVPCSVTERGPVFTIVNGSYVMKYGGGVSCAGGVGERTLDVVAQVAKYLHGKNGSWPTDGSPLATA